MIREFEFYHGIVFSRLIHGYKGQVVIKPYPTESNASYILNEKIGLYIKYSTKRMSPWGFSFKKNHQEEIDQMHNELGAVFTLLVCNDDGIVCLNYKELKMVLDENFSEVESIRINRRPKEKYAVRGTEGKLKFKIGESDFPKKLFIEQKQPEKTGILNWLGVNK